MNIKFISYTGKYPNLCRGVLTLEIDGETVKFGHDYSKSYKQIAKDGNYDSFWESGGSCGFNPEVYTKHDEWTIDIDYLPEKYKKYADQLIDIFNMNVPYGCCGGCI